MNEALKRRVRLHLQYSWWKYLLALVISVMSISMIFDMTEYRPPEDKKTDLYILTGPCDTEGLHSYLFPRLQERFPEQEELTVITINLVNEDMYSRMQYSTYVAARQGDVMLMPIAEVQNLLKQDEAGEIFDDLTPYIQEGLIDCSGMDLTQGEMKGPDGEKRIYGIPSASLKGLEKYYISPENTLLVSMSYGGNLKTAAGLIGLMVDEFREKKE